MTTNQKLRREMERHIDKALLLAESLKDNLPNLDFELLVWDDLIMYLENAKDAAENASFLADEREARDA